jgi:hypothetical protein
MVVSHLQRRRFTAALFRCFDLNQSQTATASPKRVQATAAAIVGGICPLSQAYYVYTCIHRLRCLGVEILEPSNET